MESNYKKEFVPSSPREWKKWKEERKAQKRKWREEKLLEELEKEQIKNNKEHAEEIKKPKYAGREYTVSIALPGSILDNAQTPELRTYLAGQIARAAVVFNVDEIVIFDEAGTSSNSTEGNYEGIGKHGNCNVQMARVLQYLECPQYLRKAFFPKHKDLEYAGLLNPVGCPHHVKAEEKAPYREGVILDVPPKEGRGSYANVGLVKNCQIDKKLQPGVRVTVRMDDRKEGKKKVQGTVVSPSCPREETGIYWGYSVRLASSLGQIFTHCPHKGGYDITVGTSERGHNVDNTSLSKFKHLLVVFGGVKGLEASLEADQDLHVEDPKYLFNYYLNTCPNQGSNTIRTEEAILITMSALRPKILQAQLPSSSS